MRPIVKWLAPTIVLATAPLAAAHPGPDHSMQTTGPWHAFTEPDHLLMLVIVLVALVLIVGVWKRISSGSRGRSARRGQEARVIARALRSSTTTRGDESHGA